MKEPKNVKILLVDDDQDYLLQQKIELEEEGYTILTAGSRREASAIFDKEQPDLAIIDLMMEEMDDGFVLSYEFKKKRPTVPVIIITAVTHDTGIEFDSITGKEREWIKADFIFPKPVRTEQLLGEIKILLRS